MALILPGFMRFAAARAFAALAICGAIPLGNLNYAFAASQKALPPPPTPSYARVADLVIAASTVVIAAPRSLTALKPERSPNLGTGLTRFYVEADTITLIRNNGPIAKRIAFLLDLPSDKKVRPNLKGVPLVLFGRAGAQVDQFQLLSNESYSPWSQEMEDLTRRIIGEVTAPDALPAIAKVSSAFHVGGSIEGEGETQVFLETSKGDPISLSIIRRPDEQPLFAASLGEIVDQSASLPPPDTFLWYRLACGLPARLPASALAELEQSDATRAERDYEALVAALGRCAR